MKYTIVFIAVLLVGCAQTAVQTMSQVCGVYSSTLVSLSVYKPSMSDDQKASVDSAVFILAPICEGPMPTGDASDMALSSLDGLEALLFQLKEMEQ